MSFTTQAVIDGAAELFQLFATSRPPLNTDITVTCDALGRKIKKWDPDSGWWKYGYDKVGNLIHQEDPKTNQHVQFCYDAINRVTKKQYFSTDSYAAGWCSQTAAQQISSFYDAAAVAYSVGRLTTVNDLSGGTLYKQYDVRGRARWIDKQLNPNGHATTATTLYEYGRADHVWKITYPDTPAEQVVYGVNAEGKVVSLQNASGSPTYLSDLWYDVFGRPTKITHGNGTTDTPTYGTETANFRLASISTTQGSNIHLNLSYASYTKTGLLTQLTDLRNGSGDLSNTATYTYDGLGRLTQASGVKLPPPNTYGYDPLGNMTLKEGTTFGYSATKPHTLATINGSPTGIGADPNGNRTGKPNQSYGYTKDDRVETITVGGQTVTEYYDYTGRQVARQIGSSWTRYYSELAEQGPDGYLTKHYFAGGVRIASSRVYAPQLAGLPGEPAIMVAQAPAGHAAVVVLLRTDVQQGVLLAVGIIGTGLLLAPWRRKRVVGIAVRHGHVVGIIFVWTFATLPFPLLLRRAEAQSTPTLYHYHMDHLGSTQVITDGSTGAVVEQIRYKPYGEIRYRSATTNNRYEFTGYETETTSNLEYAGARFYDPTLGQFLTHDPARQFASPYTYTNWNPTNLTDPNGACVLLGLDCLTVALIAVAATTAATMIDAGIRSGGNAGAIFSAGMLTGMIGIATVGIGFGLVGPAVGGIADQAVQQAVAYSLAGAGIASGGYGTYQAFDNGYYASGVVGAVLTALSAYALLWCPQGANGGLSQQAQLDFAQAEYDQLFSYGEVPVQYADARGVTLNDATTNPYAPYDALLGDPQPGQIDLQLRVKTTGYCNGAVCGAVGKPGDPGYGLTKSGLPAARGTIAADPNLFAAGTRVNVPGYGAGTVMDMGGAIRGLRLDLWFATRPEAIAWGVRNVTVTVRIPVQPLP